MRAVQYFSTENWRPVSQSARVATFQGKPPIPWFMLLLTVLAFLACIVPGIFMYVLVIRKVYRFHNLVITANPSMMINGTRRTCRIGFRYPAPPTSIGGASGMTIRSVAKVGGGEESARKPGV